MSRNGTRRSAAIGVIAMLIVAAGAYAYWTTNGSGSGTGAAASGVSGLTVNQTTVLTGMYPGDSAQTLSGTFGNTNDGPVRVGTVTASIASVVKDVGAPAGTCDATDFTLTGAAMAVNADVPVGDPVGAWTGAAIQFNNKTTNQDACKGATVNLAYAVS